MLGRQRLLNSSRKFSTGLIALNVICLVLIGIVSTVPDWVSLHPHHSEDEFSGNLYQVTRGEKIQHSLYTDLKDKYCDESDDFSKAACSTFSTLVDAHEVYWTYLGIGCAAIVAKMLILLIQCCIFNCSFLLIPASIVTMVCCPLAIFMYDKTADLVYHGTCTDFNHGDEPGSLCAEIGPHFSIALSFGIVVVGVFEIIVTVHSLLLSLIHI